MFAYSSAFGAKRTCMGVWLRPPRSLMTRTGHRRPKFAVMHNTAPMNGCGRVWTLSLGEHMRRRDFITLLGGAAAAWPQAAPLGVAFAQSNERVRVGYLWIGAEGSDGQTLSGVRQGLADVGLVEGRNLVIERRYADSHPERLSALAMELVRLDVAVLLAPGAVVTRAARSATETIPIVSVTNDPVALGFAQTLARPGGNVTGLAITASDQLVEKWVELLKDVRPTLKRAALLYDPRPAPMVERVAHDASVTIGIEIMPFRVTDSEELGAALAAIEMARPDGLLISNDALLLSSRSRLVAFARDRALPAVYGQREYVDAGGLMSYSTSIYDVWRRAGSVVSKLLKGGKASEIPIELPTKFELVINLKTAKALGLDVPLHLQQLADEVIE
jgi:putative ABC transport system substrate-binding protein